MEERRGIFCRVWRQVPCTKLTQAGHAAISLPAARAARRRIFSPFENWTQSPWNTSPQPAQLNVASGITEPSPAAQGIFSSRPKHVLVQPKCHQPPMLHSLPKPSSPYASSESLPNHASLHLCNRQECAGGDRSGHPERPTERETQAAAESDARQPTGGADGPQTAEGAPAAPQPAGDVHMSEAGASGGAGQATPEP